MARQNEPRLIAAMLLLSMGLATGCQAPSPSPAAIEPAAPVEPPAPAPAVLLFTEQDRQVVHDYYHVQQPLPPDLADSARLAPEQRELIEPGKAVPPGLGVILPRPLERQLRPLPKGYLRLRAGMDIVLIDLSTQLILDVIRDVDQ